MDRTVLRKVKDLGMWALDRGSGSCKFKTEFCTRTCYNNKFNMYPAFRAVWAPGGKDDQRWEKATSESFSDLDRVRLCTRGEAITCSEDIDRIAQWAKDNPDTLFWIPTRAWQSDSLLAEIEIKLKTLSNIRVLMSLDPSNTKEEWEKIKARGHSTMFYGNDAEHPLGDDNKIFKCTKTWKHLKDQCKTCNAGCFSKKQKHVWLKKH